MRSRLNTLLMILFLCILLPPLTHASSTVSEYSLSVTNDAVSVSMSINISQNLTAFDKSFSLPQLHGILEGSNSTEAAGVIQNALRSNSHQAQVSDLTLGVDSTQWSNTTSLQWFNVSLSMKVTGVVAVKGNSAQADLSWKSFNVSSDVSLGTVEVNNIGEKLLSKISSELATQTSSNPAIHFRYFIGTVEVGAPSFPSLVEGIQVLSFSRFAVPLSGWTEKYDPLAQTSTWTLNPGQVFLGMRFVEELETESLVYQLSATLGGQVVGPGNHFLNRDTLTFPLGNLPEALMGITILSTSLAGVGAFVYERRLQNKPTRQRSRR